MELNVSQKIQERIQSPKRKRRIGEHSYRFEVTSPSELQFEAQVFVLSGDKKIVDLGIEWSGCREIGGLLDLVSDLMVAKGPIQICEISWREIESFTRDRNDIPSFSGPKPGFCEEFIWRPFLQTLLKAYFRHELSQAARVTGMETENFSELPFVEKIRFVNNAIEKGIRPMFLCHQVDVELVHVTGNKVFVKPILDESLKPLVLPSLLETCEEFLLERANYSLKVVAE